MGLPLEQLELALQVGLGGLGALVFDALGAGEAVELVVDRLVGGVEPGLGLDRLGVAGPEVGERIGEPLPRLGLLRAQLAQRRQAELRGEGAEVASARARRLGAVGARPRIAFLGALSRDLVVQISELLLDERNVFGADEPVVSLVGLNRLLGFDHIGAQRVQLLGDRRAVLARGVGVQVADLVDVGLRGGVGELGGALGARATKRKYRARTCARAA